MTNYEDIIHLTYPPKEPNRKHLPMSMHDRAAQFAPFAALTGHEEAIDETARRTERVRDLGENAFPEDVAYFC